MAMSSQKSLKSVDDDVQPVLGEHGLASETFLTKRWIGDLIRQSGSTALKNLIARSDFKVDRVAEETGIYSCLRYLEGFIGWRVALHR
jgi:hypothetical protein